MVLPADEASVAGGGVVVDCLTAAGAAVGLGNFWRFAQSGLSCIVGLVDNYYIIDFGSIICINISRLVYGCLG